MIPQADLFALQNQHIFYNNPLLFLLRHNPFPHVLLHLTH